MNKDIELRKLVKDAWEELCRAFVPRNYYDEKQLQKFLYDKLVETRGNSKGIEREYRFHRWIIDFAIDKKVFIELKVHLKSGARTDRAWNNRFGPRHALRCFEKFADIRKEYPDALCYYAVYADSHKDEDDSRWQELDGMCHKEKIEFLLCWKK